MKFGLNDAVLFSEYEYELKQLLMDYSLAYLKKANDDINFSKYSFFYKEYVLKGFYSPVSSAFFKEISFSSFLSILFDFISLYHPFNHTYNIGKINKDTYQFTSKLKNLNISTGHKKFSYRMNHYGVNDILFEEEFFIKNKLNKAKTVQLCLIQVNMGITQFDYCYHPFKTYGKTYEIHLIPEMTFDKSKTIMPMIQKELKKLFKEYFENNQLEQLFNYWIKSFYQMYNQFITEVIANHKQQ